MGDFLTGSSSFQQGPLSGETLNGGGRPFRETLNDGGGLLSGKTLNDGGGLLSGKTLNDGRDKKKQVTSPPGSPEF